MGHSRHQTLTFKKKKNRTLHLSRLTNGAHLTSLHITSLCKAEGIFRERIRCWIAPAPRDVSVQHQWQRRSTRKTSHCTNQYKHNVVCSWRLLWAENTDSHLYPRPRWWRQHLRLSNIRGCSQGRLSTYVARFQLVSPGDTECLYTTYHINHRWLIKQPWWMEKLQTIHLLHHIGGMSAPGWAEVTHHATKGRQLQVIHYAASEVNTTWK